MTGDPPLRIEGNGVAHAGSRTDHVGRCAIGDRDAVTMISKRGDSQSVSTNQVPCHNVVCGTVPVNEYAATAVCRDNVRDPRWVVAVRPTEVRLHQSQCHLRER